MEIAKERVQHRVSQGGHGIPTKDIERRYQESFQNLVGILAECDNVTFYDNTKYFKRIALYENGKMELFIVNTPKWFEKIQQ